MQENTYRLLTENMGISAHVLDIVDKAEKDISSSFEKLDDITAYNQYKVLDAFQKNNISDTHFAWNTGYGYDDAGRDAVERVYADIFHTDAALVRPLIVNGTHALTLTLTGILRPGDEMIYCTGGPYDTLEDVIGIRGEGKGSLKEFGITYKQVELTPDGKIDLDALKAAISPATRMVCMQRSTGYGWRRAISIDDIAECVQTVKSVNSEIICMADNCYGEFLDTMEPTDVGVDVMAGSLIKNPGGGLALAGGYDVKLSEVHGMAQRGGSVVTYVRYGENVAEPIVEEGQADVIIAFEKLEALRYAHFLKKDGALIVNDWRIDPMPVVIGAAEYPENILENLKKDHKVYTVNATEEAKKLGNSRVFNLIVLGIAAQHMDFTKEQWYEVIEKTVPPKTIDINKKAFDVGYQL